jgi:hypothetical protein
MKTGIKFFTLHLTMLLLKETTRITPWPPPSYFKSNHNWLRELSVIVFLIALTIASTSAQTLRFEGPFKINGFPEGRAIYSYRDQDGLQEKIGNFRFSTAQRDSLGTLQQTSIDGSYSQGKKSGLWQIKNAFFNLDLISVGSNYVPNYHLSGEEFNLSGNFKNGVANGKWNFETKQIKEGRSQNAHEKFSGEFRNGLSINKIFFENTQAGTILEGQFDSEHFFDGIWRISYKLEGQQIQEIREYKNGLLFKLRLENTQTKTILSEIIFENTIEKYQNLGKTTPDLVNYRLGDTIFDISDFIESSSMSDSEKTQISGNRFIVEQFQSAIERAALFTLLEGSEPFRFGGLRKFEYVLKESEQKMVTDLDQNIKIYRSTAEKFLNTSTLTLNSQFSDSLAKSLAVLENTLSKLNKGSEIIDLINSGYFKYNNIEDVFPNGVAEFRSNIPVNYIYKGDTLLYTYIIPQEITDGVNFIESMHRYFGFHFEKLDGLEEFLKNTLIEIEEFLVNQRLEENIISSNNKIRDLYFSGQTLADSIDFRRIRFHDDVYANYLPRLSELMRRYSEEKDSEIKSEIGEDILSLNKLMTDAFFVLGDLPQLLKELDESYTRMTYNPYMDTYDIKTRIKRSIYNTATNVLIPHLLSKITSLETISESEKNLRLLTESFKKLKELSELGDRETRQLERKLRNENNAERVLRLLELV